MVSKGVLVGSDKKLEWLLPWWWSHYSFCNSFPVAFADFGLSEKMKKWCLDHGKLLQVSIPSFKQKKIGLVLKNQWEKSYGKTFLHARKSWLKKPFALLHTPYEKTIWFDLDCEILAPIDQMFDFCNEKHPIAMAREPSNQNSIMYNTGVIVYQKGAFLIEKWAREMVVDFHRFLGDQQLLSDLIHREKHRVVELEKRYNWRMKEGIPLDAKVIHWVGEWGKAFLKKYGGFKNFLKAEKSLSISLNE
ncbi:MAG: hypothetical protein L0207_01935 [Chlamydiae bacterium]|nr:hypothetical protein [Chlamydiota bacterium]